MYYLKKTLQKVYPPFLFRILKHIQRSYYFYRKNKFSEEELIIQNYLDNIEINNNNKFAVDIASQDGVLGNQTIKLFLDGYNGVAFEFDGKFFSILSSFYSNFKRIVLIKSKVTPNNILKYLDSVDCPLNFAFLSLDIDSFDFYILNSILSKYRPSLICLEINENIPPPIKFTVEFANEYIWDDENNHFQGQSISKAYELCLKYDYKILKLHYNNLFIAPIESEIEDNLSPLEAYNEGYFNRLDRCKKFPWNKDMEAIFSLDDEDKITYLKRKFHKYNGKFTIEK